MPHNKSRSSSQNSDCDYQYNLRTNEVRKFDRSRGEGDRDRVWREEGGRNTPTNGSYGGKGNDDVNYSVTNDKMRQPKPGHQKRLSGHGYLVGGLSGGEGQGRGTGSPLHPYSTHYPPPSSHHRSLNNATPVNLSVDGAHRRSPHNLDLQPRSGSQENVLDLRGAVGRSTSPHKNFDGYPNPYCEPLEVRDPLMSRSDFFYVFFRFISVVSMFVPSIFFLSESQSVP